MKNKTESHPILEEAADTVLSVLAGALTLPTIAISRAGGAASEKGVRFFGYPHIFPVAFFVRKSFSVSPDDPLA